MKIVVTLKNKSEAQKLKNFLDAMKMVYESASESEEQQNAYHEFLIQYNHELDNAVNELESNNYTSHKEVKQLLMKRSKAKKG